MLGAFITRYKKYLNGYQYCLLQNQLVNSLHRNYKKSY